MKIWYNIKIVVTTNGFIYLKTHLQVIFLYTNDYSILWIELMNFWWCMMFLLIMNRGNQLPWKICLIQTLLLFSLAAIAHSSSTFPSFPFDKVHFYKIFRFFFISLSKLSIEANFCTMSPMLKIVTAFVHQIYKKCQKR